MASFSRRCFARLALGVVTLGLLDDCAALAQTQGTPPISTEDTTSNFVRGELCAAVFVSGAVDPAAAATAYEAVRRSLNASISTQATSTPPMSESEVVQRELTAGNLLALVQPGTIDWLLPKAIIPTTTALPIQPWAVLGDASSKPGQETLLLMFYRTVQPRSDEHSDSLVRRLVNTLNDPKFPRQGDGYRFDSAMPNWWHAVSDDHSCGGPGGKPEPAAGELKFNSLNAAGLIDGRLDKLQADAALNPGTVVIILDTAPDLDDPVSRDRGLADQAVQYLQAGGPAQIAGAPSLAPADAIVWQSSGIPQLPRWYGPETIPVAAYGKEFDTEFDVSDHGLFVAGIVRQIAPNADIRLIRVLGKYGVGDTHRLASVIERLVPELPSNRNIVINMSLMADYPSSNRIAKRWFPGLPDNRTNVYDKELVGDIRDAIERIHLPLLRMMEALVAPNVLVVAAAGNDMLPGDPRPVARFPARYPSVFCVSALTHDFSPAPFSNRAEGASNAIAALGGSGDLSTAKNGPTPAVVVGSAPPTSVTPPAIVSTAGADFGPRMVPASGGQGDAVVGLFTARYFPLSHFPNPNPPLITSGLVPNTTGWALWSGTSFATPIVAGLAANVWAAKPTLPPISAGGGTNNVRAAVQDLADPVVDRDLNCRPLRIQQA